MRAPGPGQLFGLSRCSGAATQAQSRPHRPRGNRSTAPRFAPGNTCSRGDSEDTRGSCWRRYQKGLGGAGPPPPSAAPLQGEERDYAKVSGCRGYLAESSTVSPRGRCVHVSARARRGPIEILAAEGGNDGVGRGGRNDGEGRSCNDPLRSRLRRHRRHAVSSCPDSLVAASRRRPWGPP